MQCYCALFESQRTSAMVRRVARRLRRYTDRMRQRPPAHAGSVYSHNRTTSHREPTHSQSSCVTLLPVRRAAHPRSRAHAPSCGAGLPVSGRPHLFIAEAPRHPAPSRHGHQRIEREHPVFRTHSHRAPMARDDPPHRAQAKPVVDGVSLGGLRQPVRKPHLPS